MLAWQSSNAFILWGEKCRFAVRSRQSGKSCFVELYLKERVPMRKVSHFAGNRDVPRERAWRMCPRKYLRSLPTRTRPSLFGSD